MVVNGAVGAASVNAQAHMYTKHPQPFLLNNLLRTFWHQAQIAFCGLVRREEGFLGSAQSQGSSTCTESPVP